MIMESQQPGTIQKPKKLNKISIKKPEENATVNVPTQLNREKGIMRAFNQQDEEEKGEIANYQTIHFAHENFNMVLNIMLGIKKAVDATYEHPLLKITDKDFRLRC